MAEHARRYRFQIGITNLFLLLLAAGFAAAWIREAGGFQAWWSKYAKRSQLGLAGFDPVILLQHMRWERGSTAYEYSFEGRTFRFVSAIELAKFQDSPEKYAPVFGGRDVVIANDENRAVDGDRSHGLVYYGRIYLFANESSLARFEASPGKYFQRLDSQEASQ